jgi:DNA-binding XRE family transcriptional regulator
LELGLTQKQAALRLLAKTDTYFLSEKGHRKPIVRNYPAILRFLGYDPFPRPKSWHERVAAKRRALGLTIEAAAKLAGVDPVAFGKWERGQAVPHACKSSAKKFLSVPAEGDTSALGHAVAEAG